MTIRTNTTNNNSNHKSFVSTSAPSTEEEIDAVAFNVNADVFNEGNISFAHATSVTSTDTTGGYGQLNNNNNNSATTTNAANNTAHQTTPIAYSTGKPPQPPQTQPRSSSSSVAVATGAPTATPTSTTTQTTSTSTTTSTTRGNNSQCCTGTCTTVQRWICCGITSTVLLSIFLCCILPFILVAISIGSAANSKGVDYYYDDDYWNDFLVLLMILMKKTYYTSLTIFIVMRLKRRAVQSHPTQTPQIPLTLQIPHPMKMKIEMKINDYYMETKMKKKIIVPSFVIVCMARYYYDTSQNNITSHRIKPINNIIVILLRKLYD